MVAIRVTTDSSSMDKARKDWEKKVARFRREVARDISDTVEFIVDRKLRLEGVAVRLGGTPGPSPGSPPSPVLHRDTGALAGAVMVSWPSRLSTRDISFVVEIGMESSMIYAPTHEYGDPARGIPARPFMQPAADRLVMAIHTTVASLMNG